MKTVTIELAFTPEELNLIDQASHLVARNYLDADVIAAGIVEQAARAIKQHNEYVLDRRRERMRGRADASNLKRIK